jgi:lysophospholipase L1-like esterase
MRRWTLIALAVSVLINVVGVALYLLRPTKDTPRSDVYGHDREDMFEELARGSADVVMLGDSLTDRGEWTELLARERVVNRGVAGDTIADARARLAPIKALRARTIVVMLGINDLLEGRSVAACADDYRRLLADLAAFEPPPRIVVQSVLPVGAKVPLSNQTIRELNDQLRTLCVAPHCEFLDVFSVLAGPDGALPPALSSDGVHLDGDAYVRWADALKPRL